MKKINDIAIQLINVSKKYEIHHEKPTLVEKFVNGQNETFWALKDINLTIKKGERIGIIGPNGSGKTTLLKIIAGITMPTTGSVITKGKTVSLIDLDAGFHMDLSGIQNIYLNGMLLGMTKQKIDNLLSSIIDFADIKQFIDIPLYTYSNGMILRLGFSIAIHTSFEILLLDESVYVGDIFFQKKVNKFLNELYKSGKTIILVSHQFEYISKTCKRIVILENNSIERIGDISLIQRYLI